MNFYNENDPKAAAWLRELIAAGLIPPGDVCETSITDIKPEDLHGYTQCHFFAGIGGWSVALKLAGWPEDRPVWTGSCPCQPFSAAGKRGGRDDERHLWPEFSRLIRECRPNVIFGEQVASADGREWLSGSATLQRMLDAEAIDRVLQGLGLCGRIPIDLQDMLSQVRIRPQIKDTSTGEIGAIQEMEEEQSGVGPAEFGETQGQTKGSSFFLGSGSYSRCHRCGRVRIDDDSVQSGRREDMGQSLFGQDQFIQGIHSRQCACGAVLLERDGECVGREQNCRDGGGNNEGEAEPFGALSISFGGIAEKALEHPSIAGVRADMEGMGYVLGAADLCAAGVGAPHRRQRLFWVGLANSTGCEPRRTAAAPTGHWHPIEPAGRAGDVGNAQLHGRSADPIRPAIGEGEGEGEGGMREHQGSDSHTGDSLDHANGRRREQSDSGERTVQIPDEGCFDSMGHAEIGGLGERGNAACPRSGGHPECSGGAGLEALDNAISNGRGAGGNDHGEHERVVTAASRQSGGMAHTGHGARCAEREEQLHERDRGSRQSGAWDYFDIIPCRDGKARRIESGTFPVVAGLPRGVVPSGDPGVQEAQATAEARTMRLRGYGNAIVPQVAVEFILAALESRR